MVVIRVSFSADGTPIDFELIESSGPSETGIKKLFETAQRAVRAPILRQLHARTRQLLREALKLLFEALEQRKRVRRRASKANDHRAIRKPAHLARIALEDCRAG